jgi:hypothetical protein
MEQLCIRSFLYHGHAFHLYIYDDVRDIPNGTTVCDANTILPVSRVSRCQGCDQGGKQSYCSFADLFRYKLLKDKGSWWADTDFICMKPFDFKSLYVLFGDDSGVSPALIKVPSANDPFISWVYEQAEKVFCADVPWGVTGSLVAAGVQKFSLAQHVQPISLFLPVNNETLVAESLDDAAKKLCEQAYTVHCFNELWRVTGLNKDGLYPATCLYEQLLRKYGVR